MLALRNHTVLKRVRPSPLHTRTALSRTLQRRLFWSEVSNALTPAANEFLDLAIALPFPPSFPPYASTVILGSVLLRLAFLPTVLWVCVAAILGNPTQLIMSVRVAAKC